MSKRPQFVDYKADILPGGLLSLKPSCTWGWKGYGRRLLLQFLRSYITGLTVHWNSYTWLIVRNLRCFVTHNLYLMHTPSQTYNDICWLCHCWFKNHRPIAGQGCKALEIILAHLVTLYKSSKLYLRRYITYYKVHVLLEEYLYLKFAQLKKWFIERYQQYN